MGSGAKSLIAVWLFAACTAQAAPSDSWCDLLFREVAADAEAVALVEYRSPRGTRPSLVMLETFKGDPARRALRVDPAELGRLGARNGDRFLLALGQDRDLVRSVAGAGDCHAISVLPLRGDELRAAHRADYDGASESLTLDQLRSQLAATSHGRLAAGD